MSITLTLILNKDVPYFQAKELLANPNASLEELLKALFDLGKEWGHIASSTEHGLRENAKPDLTRIIVLSDMIIYRIQQEFKSKYDQFT